MNLFGRRIQVVSFPLAITSAFAIPAASSADFSGYVTATTDYVRRGVTQSDSDPALQLGVDYSFDSGIYIGAWGSTVDISSFAGSQRDLELTYYVGYIFDASHRWTVGANAVVYTYPGMTGRTDYDYIEYALTTNFEDTFWFEYAYSPNLYNTGSETHNYEFYVERPAFSKWFVGGGAGYFDVSRLSGTGYGYWQLGLTRAIGQFEFDFRYHDTNRSVPFISTPDRSESRAVFSVSFSF